MCNNDVMVSLLKMKAKKLVDLYSDFYTAIFLKGRDCQLVNGGMTCAALTPPWLRAPVEFLYGPNSNISIPFAMQALTRKNIIREKVKKIYWLRDSRNMVVKRGLWHRVLGIIITETIDYCTCGFRN